MASKSRLSILLLTGAALAHAAGAAGGHYSVTGQIDAPEGAWTFASIDAATHRLYVGRSTGMLAVDLQTRKTTAFTLDGKRVQMIVPIPGTDLVVGTQDTSNVAIVADGRTGAVLAKIPAGRRPETAAYDAASGLVAVMAGSAEVTLIDPKTRTAVGSIPVPGILESGATDGKGRLYINLEDRNAIAVVDLAGRKQVGTYALHGCEGPTGIGFDARTNLLISACGNQVAKVIDAASGADRGTVPIAGGADAVLIDTERRVALIPCSQGRLVVISLAEKPKQIESVVTAQGARTGAVDPSTGRIYLPVGRAPETDFGAREVPGFAVLVVEAK